MSNDKIILIVVGLLIILGGGYFAYQYMQGGNGETDLEKPTDPKNATYLIKESEFSLYEGYAEKEIEGNMVKVSIFKGPLSLDLDGDYEEDDFALILKYDLGEEGTNYYVTAAITDPGGVVIGKNAVPIGGTNIEIKSFTVEKKIIKTTQSNKLAEEANLNLPNIDREFALNGVGNLIAVK